MSYYRGNRIGSGRILPEKKTIKEILSDYGSVDRDRISVFLGSSVKDITAQPMEKRKAGRNIDIIESNTIASDFRVLSGCDLGDFGCEDADTPMLVITIDGSMDRDNPNIRRYMNGGHTYPQAKTLHMYNLGLYGNKSQ